MRILCQYRFFYGSIQQSPINRISASRIIKNVQSHKLTYQLVNNLQIAYDCSKIAIKYSKCYMCRVWGVRSLIRDYYQMKTHDQTLNKINALFVEQCPIPKYQTLFSRFQYQNKGIYAALSLVKSETINEEHKDSIIKFLTSLQVVNLGFSLHHSIGKSHKLNLLTRLALKMMSKQLKDSYLVLGGDYFHIKGSLLTAEIKDVNLSKLLAQVQIDFCKYVHLTEQLKNKILDQGYDQVDIKDIYNISVLKTSPISKGLRAIDMIRGQTSEKVENKNEIYEIIGLLVLYRKDLESFMFNFKDIVKKYFEYSANRINFDCEQSLPYYIFFQGAKNKRIDTSYLNTVTMMSDEIKFLESRLRVLVGEEESQKIERKIHYYLMFYS